MGLEISQGELDVWQMEGELGELMRNTAGNLVLTTGFTVANLRFQPSC